MSTIQIVLNVSGGVVQDVFASQNDVEVLLVDWDTDSSSRDDPALVTVVSDNGCQQQAYVADLTVQGLEDLPGTDVAAAIEVSNFAFR
jgi:hypothetical protein